MRLLWPLDVTSAVMDEPANGGNDAPSATEHPGVQASASAQAVAWTAAVQEAEAPALVQHEQESIEIDLTMVLEALQLQAPGRPAAVPSSLDPASCAPGGHSGASRRRSAPTNPAAVP